MSTEWEAFIRELERERVRLVSTTQPQRDRTTLVRPDRAGAQRREAAEREAREAARRRKGK